MEGKKNSTIELKRISIPITTILSKNFNMPKENKHSRGKRGGDKSKRKRDEAEDGDDGPSKRQRPTEMEEIQYAADNAQFDHSTVEGLESTERPFYGLLEEDEQEYFRHADELLEANDFENDEQRQLFLSNIYREAEGKELKIANSQSCSRLMERLILLSTPAQKKTLFEKFGGNFLHLIQHRFASHCCETLFIQSAPIVTAELLGEKIVGENTSSETSESMENLFLFTLNELEGSLASLLTDRFASHTLRVLLMVLSGKSPDNAKKSLLQSKKKEKITVHGNKSETGELRKDGWAVPDSFRLAVDKIKSDTIINDESGFVDLLATNPMGNPCLQLLLEIELTTQQGKTKGNDEKSIIRKLLPDDLSAPDSKGVSFINGLVYDSIGSRLIETIVTYAPGKLFRQIYKACFKERMGSLARNETAGFVIIKVLERLSLEDLRDALSSILPQIPSLVERSRTSVIRTLLERCVVRGADTRELAKTLKSCYGENPKVRISTIVNLEPRKSEDGTKQEMNGRNFSQLHGSLLAQTMLDVPGPLSELIQDSLLAQSSDEILRMSQETFTSHIIQAALKPLKTNIAFRRKLVNKLLPLVPALALHNSGSHVVDALWIGTEGIMNLKERIAMSLQEHESELRESFDGRKIWRNWMMDLFKRQKSEWVKKAKAGDGGAPDKKDLHIENQGNDGTKGAKESNGARLAKTKLELAREKFWLEKEKGGVKTGANTT